MVSPDTREDKTDLLCTAIYAAAARYVTQIATLVNRYGSTSLPDDAVEPIEWAFVLAINDAIEHSLASPKSA